jgi:hypothetical protein
MALMYLVNKPQVFGKINRWLLLFLEYDFKFVYKPDRSHLIVNALNRLPNQAKSFNVPDQTNVVQLFTLQLEWLQNVYDNLSKWTMPKIFTTSQQLYLAQRTKPFVLQNEIVYIFGQDNGFCCALQLEHVPIIL